MEKEKLTLIKKDAQIPLIVGTGFLSRLQQVLLSLLEDKTEEELQILTNHIQENSVPVDTWMYHFETISLLIREIEAKAFEKGLVEEVDV